MLLGFNMYIMFFIVSLSIKNIIYMQEKEVPLTTSQHAHIVIVHTNRYRVRIQGFMNFYTNRGWTHFLAFIHGSVKSTKTYLKVSLHARDTPAFHSERFMLTKSPLTHTMTTHQRRRRRRDGDGRRRNEKSSSSEINLRNEFNTLKLEQPMSLENGRTVIRSFRTKFSSYNKI